MRTNAAGLLLLALGGVVLTGCKPVGPNYQRPGFSAPDVYKESSAKVELIPPPNPENGGWQKTNPSDGMLRGKWWEVYNDPQLNQLEERIATYNQGVKGAVETYLAARDQIAVARSGLYPTLSAGPGFEHNKLSKNRPLASSTDASSYNLLTLEGTGSWEPDFWGKIRRTVESNAASAQASAADKANYELSLQAMMATAYFEMRGQDSARQILEQSVHDAEKVLALTRTRREAGLASEADVALAETTLETTRAQWVEAGVSRAQYEHMVGSIADIKLPGFSLPPTPLTSEPPIVPLGVPSQLLERRPDIAAAERRAAAANAQIGVAQSAYYPTIQLSGTGGFESTHGGTWIQGPSALWSLGAQATQLLFDAGQRHALTDAARHNYEYEVTAYKSAIFLAFNDVEDQLSTLRILNDESTIQQRAVDAAERSFKLTSLRYQAGNASLLDVLTAENALLTARRAASDVVARRYVASVSLIRSLGGGWDNTQLPK